MYKYGGDNPKSWDVMKMVDAMKIKYLIWVFGKGKKKFQPM